MLPPGRLLVGLSGGADSVALLLMLLEARRDVVAAHCNFGLRGKDADADEEFVRQLCFRHAVPLRVRRFPTREVALEPGISIEMAARELRYAWFEELLKEEDCQYVCVAHHADDNVETFLLNLVRGSGVRGLSGMKTRQGHVLRPLLDKTHEELKAWLLKRGECWREDASNADTRFRRNKIRHEVLPLLRELNPSVDAGIQKAMRSISTAEVALGEATSELMRTSLCILPDGVELRTEDFADSPYAEELLFRVLQSYGFPPYVATDMARHLHEEGGNLYETPDYIATRTVRSVEVRRRAEEPEPLVLRMGENPLPEGGLLRMSIFTGTPDFQRRECAYLDADLVQGDLVYRPCQRGDRFAPYGMKGSKLISDYMAGRGMSRVDRMRARLVCDANSVAWVVGDRVARYFAVTGRTRRILLLEYVRA
ncbi:MAG: tRNA lysidine(34) synthetase TilS [Alloprevotella sp.]|nr:tRNA lysidine(34) synthetase TilS [Bacteroidales bacterium]MBR1653272.1 tRNA lysidine(34) synthetase TilS [Alloprevotella sp.]